MTNVKIRRQRHKSLADRFDGEAMLIFWSFRYFLFRQSIQAASFASTLATCVDQLPEKIRTMMKDEIERGLLNPYDIPKNMHAEWKKVLERLS